MNSNEYMKGNRSKLLVAVMAMFVVLASAAVVLSDTSDAAVPTPDFADATTVPVDDIKDFGTDNTITVSKPTVYNITKTIGSAEAPVDLAFILDAPVQFTTDNGSKLYIQNDHQNATFMFTETGNILEFDGIEVYLDSNVASSSVFNMNANGVNGAVSVINGAIMNVTHTQGASTWMGSASQSSESSYLLVNGTETAKSVVNFNQSNSLQEVVVVATNADINFNDVKYTGIVLKNGTTLDNSSIEVSGAGYNGLQFNGTVDVKNGSSIDVTGANKLGTGSTGIAVAASAESVAANLKIDKTSSVSTTSIGFLGSTSSATISGEGTFEGDLEKGTQSEEATFTLTDITLSGNNKVSGVTVDGAYTIGEKSALLVESDAKLSGTVTNNGTLTMDPAAGEQSNFTLSNDSTGTTGVTGTSNAVLGGTIDTTSTQTTFGTGQIVNVVDDLVIDGAIVTIKGVLNNDEGFSIEIINGGQLVITGALATFTNNGTISVEVAETDASKATVQPLQINSGAKFVNNGTVTLESMTETDSDLMINAGIIDNYGSIEFSDGIFTNAGTFNNKAGAVFTIAGTYTNQSAGKLNNEGNVVVDGVSSGDGFSVYNTAEGATVTVTSISGKITVFDSDLTSKRELKAGDNYIALNSTDKTESVGGVVITSTVVEYEKEYYKTMQVSGTVDVTLGEGDAENATANFLMNGPAIVVKDTLNLGENLNPILSGDSGLYVSGTMNISEKGAADLDSGNITVTGTIVSVESITATQINAAMYITPATAQAQKLYYYTTLDKAIEGATAAQVNKIEVTGDVTLDVDATIPSGMTVTIDKNAELTIDEVTLTVADGGKINNKGLIDVDGTLYAAVEKTGMSGSGDIQSDVVSRGEVDVRYTTLANAIAAAGSDPVTITLYGNVKITSDLIIPENVTVDTDSFGFNVYGAKLTVNGTLFLNGTEKGTTEADYYVYDNTENKNITKTGEVVVNGYIKSTGETIYDNKGFPAGAYYYVYGTESFYYITTVANAAAAAQTADDGITVFGKNTAGSVEFTGTADEPVAVEIANNAVLSADSLKLTYATLDINGRYDGTVTSDVGSVVLVNVTGVDFESGVDSEDVAYFAVAGEPVKIGKDTTDPDASMTISSGTVTVVEGSELNLLADSDVEFSIEATLAIDGQMSVKTPLIIAGTMDVNNGAIADFDANVYVTGALNVAAATEDAAAGSASIGILYIGVDDEYVGSPSASVTATTINELTTVYLLTGATVSDSVIEDLAYKTELYVEDALWITVYTNGVQAVAPTDIPTENVELTQWVGTKNDNTVSKIANGTKFDVGNPARLDADIKYDIYTVTVFADPGIDAVYIDGKLMTKGYYEVTETEQSVEGFRLNISAGTHEITYKLGNYFSGEATMTVNGEAVTGNTFTTSGTDVPEDTQVTIYLQGIEPSAPETPSTGGSSDDGMGLTDYLLIILVVLIVVMAIIVALRLMRS